VTAALAFFTWKLWRSTGDLVREASETAKRQLRAYVFVSEPRIQGVSAGERPVAFVTLKNSGQTPAYSLKASIRMDIATTFADVSPNNIDPPNVGHLAPGGDFTIIVTADPALTTVEHAALDAGTRTLFVYGTANYVDAFGRSHYTRLRLMTGGAARLRTDKLVSCTEGNETDDAVGVDL
jgi:hypothetical protein